MPEVECNGNTMTTTIPMRPLVMVVDDSKSDLFLVADILKSLNCDVLSMDNPLEVVDHAVQTIPDVILLDVQMPKMDGFELCNRLKEHSLLCEVPVVFLTNANDVSAKVKGFRSGGSDYLVKPVQPEELRARVLMQIGLRRTRRQLQNSEARLKSVLNNAAVCIALVDDQGRYEMVNDRCAELFGYSRDEFKSLSCRQIMTDDFHASVRRIFENLPDSSEPRSVAAGKFVKKTGEKFWGECHLTPRRDAAGTRCGFVCVLMDLSEQRKAERELRLVRSFFETCNEGLVICDRENHIIMVNPAFSKITGYSRQEVIGRNPKLLQSGRHDALFFKQMWSELLRNDTWKGEIWNRRKDGTVYPELLSISVIRNNNSQIVNYIAVFTDISEQKKVECLMQHQARHDPLTNLMNRTAFNDRLCSELARAAREKNTMALLYIDLDNFKSINDTMGHLEGDEALRKVSALLKHFFRISDIIARLGGDEFVVLLPFIRDRQQVSHIMERLYKNLRMDPARVMGVTFSIGIALYPDHGETPRQLLRNADDAMYMAKRLGKGRFCLAEK